MGISILLTTCEFQLYSDTLLNCFSNKLYAKQFSLKRVGLQIRGSVDPKAHDYSWIKEMFSFNAKCLEYRRRSYLVRIAAVVNERESTLRR